MRAKRELAHTFPMQAVLDCCGDLDGSARKSLPLSNGGRLKLEHRFSLHTIRSAMMMLVAAIVVTGGLATGKPEANDPIGIAARVHQSGSTVLAQYNPCPNGKCR